VTLPCFQSLSMIYVKFGGLVAGQGATEGDISM
jgi:hypothetical protein